MSIPRRRSATPPSRRVGLKLALAALLLAATPLVVTAWFAADLADGAYDYRTAGTVQSIAWAIGSLATVPLVLAAWALVARPVRPSAVIGLALLLALTQPTVMALGAAQLLTADLGLALLLAATTGAAFGALAAGLIAAIDPPPIGLALLAALGVSIAAAAIVMVVTGTAVAVALSILLGVLVAQERRAQPSAASSLPASSSPSK